MPKENRDFKRREKNEEIISRNCLPHLHQHAQSSPITFAPYVVEILYNE
jgi:hypothetical protein